MATPLPLSDYAARRAPPPVRHRRRSSDRQPNTGWMPVLATMTLIASIDWWMKALVRGFIPVDGFVTLWPDRLAFWHVQNPAMILGLHGDLPLISRQVITVLASILALLVLTDVVKRGHRLPAERRRVVWLCAGLASGGMLGNFGERLIYWKVTDFFTVRLGSTWLPPTNLADVAIVAALPLCAAVIRYELEARGRRRAAVVHELTRRPASVRVD
jgi:lipoprotein signal peptidase